ncbi:SMI1/KNR4 family protein [Ponticaulis sp.]|uniref:SMI1/KNR4 family protein n=1 Tax=Ponticaulis sp. TaxID=2020902 RepID=UPI000B75E661|nr:SMI1/KNR4 family protein [Ponticaulis sp.]MAJ07564.1 hypothetical protein [Ponticaulis sp.]RPG17794.1 MAG: SMI1/KNR4 family protein [Hyphomonadaceae bacterium TMED125]HBH89511.1 hypothetical protein [Hyphomonadaceae bacterium]|tara:strand:+ start:47610 stop:48020 length:411 start_codon:yes stop_codon:yes gene_type:complete
MTYTFDAQNPPVDDGEITALEELLDAPLPENYKALLKYSHGGEWPIPVAPYDFVMFEVDTVIGNLTATDFAEAFPGLLPIGGDGMSDYIALDFTGGGAAKVVGVDAVESAPEDAVYPIAETLEAFLEMVGQAPEEH